LEAFLAARDDSDFRAHVGVSRKQVGSLYDEWQILRRKLFDLPGPQESESEAMRAWLTEELERLSKGPLETATAWDDLPKMEAEPLPDHRIAYALARGELSIFAGAIDVMLVKVAKDRDISPSIEDRYNHDVDELMAQRLNNTGEIVGRAFPSHPGAAFA